MAILSGPFLLILLLIGILEVFDEKMGFLLSVLIGGGIIYAIWVYQMIVKQFIWVVAKSNLLIVYFPLLFKKVEVLFEAIKKLSMDELSVPFSRWDYHHIIVEYGDNKELFINAGALRNFKKLSAHLFQSVPDDVADYESREKLLDTQEHLKMYKYFALCFLGLFGWFYAGMEIQAGEPLKTPVIVGILSTILLIIAGIKFLKIFNKRY